MLANFCTHKERVLTGETTEHQKMRIVNYWGKRFVRFVSARGSYIRYEAETWNAEEINAAWNEAKPVNEYYKTHSGNTSLCRIDHKNENNHSINLLWDNETKNEYYIDSVLIKEYL